jgi:hypothetical protein
MNQPTVPGRIRATDSIRLEKSEIFVLCEALALAERGFIRAGMAREAAVMGSVFDAIEARLFVVAEQEADLSEHAERIAV